MPSLIYIIMTLSLTAFAQEQRCFEMKKTVFQSSGEIKALPVVRPDGVVIIGDINGNVSYVGPDGSLKNSVSDNGPIKKMWLNKEGGLEFLEDAKLKTKQTKNKIQAKTKELILADKNILMVDGLGHLKIKSPVGAVLGESDLGSSVNQPLLAPDGRIIVSSKDKLYLIKLEQQACDKAVAEAPVNDSDRSKIKDAASVKEKKLKLKEARKQ